VAAFVGQPVWAAIAGAGLGLVYWALEILTWRRARGRQDLALGLALGGMGVRIAVVLVALVVIGVLDRPAFATAALSFLAAFTVYIVVRPFTYPTASAPAGQARLQ
jgi:zinc transporter ZupT